MENKNVNKDKNYYSGEAKEGCNEIVENMVLYFLLLPVLFLIGWLFDWF